jgi:hypothetical protein
MKKDKEYYENLDKRTKEYKEWKKRYQQENSTGVGDAVEKVTKATGIKKVVEWIAGEDCGCDERKEKLNKYRIKVKDCPTEEQYNFMVELFKRNPHRIDARTQDKVNKILNIVTGTKYTRSTCSSCVAGRVKILRNIYEAYK